MKVIMQEQYEDRIIKGAAELFRTYGIKAVTMDTIAQFLGMSKRTIYEKFNDKDELLFAVMDYMVQKQKEKIEAFLSSTPNVISAIFQMIKTGRDHQAAMNSLIGSDLRKYHNHVLLRLKEKCENPDMETASKIINRGKQQGLFRKEVNDEIAGRCLTGLVTMLSDDMIFPAGRFLHRDLLKNVIINYLRGISTAEGTRIINEMEPEI
jgi:TetR/AcrR family transcriptional regulator, cholesterol catabolism regulator